MQRKLVVSFVPLLVFCIAGYIVSARVNRLGGGLVASADSSISQGALQIIDPEKGAVAGSCPLRHTDVKAEISGFLSRVTVTQEFDNPYKDKIEAVYTFPLPQNAAVDDMTLHVGDRTVRGLIKPREEARAIYEAARTAGQVAGLLDQERPNIFTQSVANLMPGERVTITISYVETLKYQDGAYEFVFPMVVGPRYIPGAPAGQPVAGRSPNTAQVPDASRITPPVAARGTRAGHDISLEVALDAGVPIDEMKTLNHEVEVERPSTHNAIVRLKNRNEIPNKDFVLRYDVAGRRVEDALLTHRAPHGNSKDGFFTFILQPPDRVTAEDVMPKEIVFVLDTSGSMMGFPIEKAKEAMKLALDGLYPQDTFNLITFSGDTHILFPQPVPATRDNLEKAQAFLASREGSGGTEMMKAIKAALDPSDAQDHVRIVCFMTDGYVGNDLEIIGEVQKHPNARVFSFGIGQSVNRFLLDKMAAEGRGEVEYVSLNDDGSAAAKRLHERIRNPLLTDVTIDWAGLPVTDVYPKRIPDLFSAKPVVVCGRYNQSGRGTIKLRGKVAGHDFVREIPIELPDAEARRDVLATLWARTKVDDLISQDYAGTQYGTPRADVKEQVTQLGLDYRLMTQFTSFVAVEEMTVTDGGQPRRVDVPVEMPEGVSYDGVFGSAKDEDHLARYTYNGPMASKSRRGSVRDTKGRVGNAPGGVAGGVMSGVGSASPAPPPAPKAAPPVEVPKESRQQTEGQQPSLSLSRLHPAIAAIVERLRTKNSKPAAAEAKFVRDGKAEIQIWLTVKSDAVMAKLKRLGFEVIAEPKTAKLVIGRLAIDKLAALAQLSEVRYVAPQTE